MIFLLISNNNEEQKNGKSDISENDIEKKFQK